MTEETTTKEKQPNFLEQELSYEQQPYSYKELKDKFGISRFRANSLLENGVFEEAVLIQGATNTQTLFTVESVEKHIEKISNDVKVLEIANELEVQKTRIFKIMADNELPYEIDNLHYSYPTAVVDGATKEEIVAIFKSESAGQEVKLSAKTNFAYRKTYGLLQPFKTPENQIRRLTRVKHDKKMEWGFYEGEEFIPIEQAITTLHYMPVYQVAKTAASKEPYIEFNFKSYDKTAIEFLDLLYQVNGIRNLYIELQSSGSLRIFTRPCQFNITDTSITLEWINNGLIGSGNIELTEDTLIIQPDMRHVSLQLPNNIMNKLNRLTEQQQLSQSELITAAILLYEEKCSNND